MRCACAPARTRLSQFATAACCHPTLRRCSCCLLLPLLLLELESLLTSPAVAYLTVASACRRRVPVGSLPETFPPRMCRAWLLAPVLLLSLPWMLHSGSACMERAIVLVTSPPPFPLAPAVMDDQRRGPTKAGERRPAQSAVPCELPCSSDACIHPHSALPSPRQSVPCACVSSATVRSYQLPMLIPSNSQLS